MAKKEVKKEVKKESKGSRSRTRRSAFERQCLSKTFKRMFDGANKEVFCMLLDAERNAKRKKNRAKSEAAPDRD
jgi:hypothetical protein